MKKNISKVISAVEWLFGLVGVVLILVATYAVLARHVLLIPTPWVDELLKLLFVWSIFVCSALAFLSDDLISLTLLEDGAREQGKEKKYGVFKLIQYVVALVISGLIVLQLLTIVSTQISTGEATTVLKYPLWALNTGVLLGMGLIAVFAIRKLVDCVLLFSGKKTALSGKDG